MEIKVINNTEIENNKDKIYSFYLNKYRPGYEKAILNSNYIVVAVQNDVVVGALRIITDNYRFALIVDFIVDEKQRNRGTGSMLINKAVDVCQQEGVTKIGLSAEVAPEKEWLVGFYEKLGFIKDKSTAMRYKK